MTRPSSHWRRAHLALATARRATFHRGAPPRPRRVALVAAAILPWCPATPALEEVPLASLAAGIEASVPVLHSQRGLEVPVAMSSRLLLPLREAQELEIEVESEGLLAVTWASESGGRVQFFGPPWRHRRLPGGAARMRLDLRQTAGWTPSSRPALLFVGTGRLAVTRLRAGFAPADPEEARASLDRAVRWAPESFGPNTVNTLTPPMWSVSRHVYLAEPLGWLLGGLLAVGVVVRRRRGHRGARNAAVAATCLAVFALWDAGFLMRFLPAVNPSVQLDPEDRIRDHHYFLPEVGELAALARRVLAPGERVGVVAHRGDWFGPNALCFNLAPRRCVTMEPGAPEHAGISKVTRLRAEEIDAVVAIHPDGPLPDGFVHVAGVSPRAFVARRP